LYIAILDLNDTAAPGSQLTKYRKFCEGAGQGVRGWGVGVEERCLVLT
jgi:hypothetical protein